MTTTTTTFMIDQSQSVTKTVMAAEMMPSLAHELAKELSRSHPLPEKEMEIVSRYHNHVVGAEQCSSAMIMRITAPPLTVWGLVKKFDQPQTYKRFLRSCRLLHGDRAEVGSVREVHCVSGLPGEFSIERLEVLDEESMAVGFCILGGEHRLQNYRSVTTVHPSYPAEGNEETVVVESYVVDIPQGNTKEETCVFVDTIIRSNLQCLARLAERMSSTSSGAQLP